MWGAMHPPSPPPSPPSLPPSLLPSLPPSLPPSLVSLPRQPPDLSRRLKLGMQQLISCGRKTSENLGKLRKTSENFQDSPPRDSWRFLFRCVALRGAARGAARRGGHKSKEHRAATAGASCCHPSSHWLMCNTTQNRAIPNRQPRQTTNDDDADDDDDGGLHREIQPARHRIEIHTEDFLEIHTEDFLEIHWQYL